MYGMFIHWGLYCIPADGEWHMRAKKVPYAEYSKLAEQFNPTKFNADTWMSIAHDGGMQFLVLTTKHHDGFALFHSKASSYNVVDATPFKRDVVKELSEAAPRHDIRFCTYYSYLADWGHPGGQAGCEHWDPKLQDGDKHAYVTNWLKSPRSPQSFDLGNLRRSEFEICAMDQAINLACVRGTYDGSRYFGTERPSTKAKGCHVKI